MNPKDSPAPEFKPSAGKASGQIALPVKGEPEKEIQDPRQLGQNTRIEAAEARTEQAEMRTEQAETHTEEAKARTEQAETRSEQAIRDSEVSYRRLFEAAKEGIMILEAHTGRIRDANPFLIELLGFSHDELVGTPIWELGPFRDIVSNKARFEQLQQAGYVVSENLPLETKDGRKIAVEFVSNVYQAGDRSVIQCNVRDITERKRTEEARLRLAAIVNSSEDAIISKTLEGIITTWNPSAEKMFGYLEAEAIGKPILMIFPPGLVHEEVEILARIGRGESVRHFETVRVRKDGKRIDVSVTISPLADREGKIMGASTIARDITDRKRAGTKLQESENRLRSLIETEPECVKVVSAEGHLLEMNQAGLAMLQADSLAEVQAKTLIEFIVPDYRAAFRRLHQQVMEGRQGTLEFEIMGLKGRRRWLETHAAPLRTATGAVESVLGITRDITERRLVEEALRKSEAKMAEAQRIGHFGSWELDLIAPDNSPANLLSWSDEVYRIFGIEPSAFGATYEAFLAAVHPADRERMEAVQRRMLAGEENLNLEHRIVRPDGTVRWVRELGELKRDDTGRATRLTGTVLDITERKTIEAERDNLFNYSEDLFCVGTFDGRLVQLNPAWTNLLGWSLPEIQNRPWLDFVHPDDHEATIRAGEQLVQGRPVRGHENRYRCKDGSYRWLSWNSHPLVEAQQIFGVVRDITERKRAETTLAAVTEALAAYVERGDWKTAMGRLLQCALDQTQSEYGFIGVVVGSTLRVLAHEGIVWDKVINREFYEQALRNYEKLGYLEFTSFNNLFGRAITTGQVVIANLPDSDPRSAGRPTGHPPMRSFLGVPIFVGDQVQGMVALANRPGGYSAEEQRRIETLVQHAGGLCRSYRQREAAILLEQERAKAEEALRESQAHLRFTLESARLGDWDLDLTTDTARRSLRHDQCFGYAEPVAEWGFEKFIAHVHPDDRARVERDFRASTSSLTPWDFECRVLWPDGSTHWISAHGDVYCKEGKPVRMLGLVTDITARKQAEEVLRVSESRLRSIIETEPECVKVVSREGRLLEMNRAGLAMLQADSLAEVQKQTLMGFIAAEYQADFLSLHRQIMAGCDGMLAFKITGLKGRKRWLETHATPLRNAAGEVESLLGVTRDITERKQAEEALREAENRKSAILNVALDAIITMDHEGNVSDFNPAAEKIFGYQQMEAIGRPLAELIIPERLRQRHSEGMARYLATGEGPVLGKRIELPALHADGHEFPVELSINRIAGVSSAMFTATLRDITERKQAESALRKSEAGLADAQSRAHIGNWELDLATKTGTWSAEMFRLFARDPALGVPTLAEFEALIHPEDRASFQRLLAESLAARRAHEQDFRVILPDGAIRWTAGRSELILDDAGQPARLIGTSQDITERKQAEAALRESEERLRLALDAAQMGTFDWDVPANRIMWSRWHEEIWGFQPGEFTGTIEAFEERVHPADLPEVKAEVARCIAAHNGFAREFRVVWPDGSVHWVQGRGEFTFGAGNQPVRMRGAVVEVTARKQAEDEVRRLNAELEQRVVERTAQLEGANKELEAFSYSVSHDLRAPLRAVNGFAGIALEDFGPQLPEEGRRLLQRISHGGQRMGELIDDLLAFSRLSRQPMEGDAVNTARLVANVLEELKPQHEGLEVQWRIGELPPCHGDAALLKQVWINLLSNALKYSRGRTPAVVEVGCLRPDSGAVYFIRDNGAGFDMKYAHKLFGVFQRLHRADEYEGTGVGLAIVQRIVHRHGGRVWAEAQENQGATFYFTLEQERGAQKS